MLDEHDFGLYYPGFVERRRGVTPQQAYYLRALEGKMEQLQREDARGHHESIARYLLRQEGIEPWNSDHDCPAVECPRCAVAPVERQGFDAPRRQMLQSPEARTCRRVRSRERISP